MSQLFSWSGQSIGVSALESVLPKNTQDWSPSEWTGWISLQFKGLSRVFSNTTSILQCSAFFTVQLSHPYMTTGKTIAMTRRTFVGKVMSLLFNMLSRLVITFLPRSKRLLISWLQSPSAVILEPRTIKSDTVSTVSPSISHEVMGPDAMIFVFWMLCLAEMDLKVKASRRSKTHYGLELFSEFWLQGAFLHMCGNSLILYSDTVFASLCPGHDYSLRCLQETKILCLPCFCCYFHFQEQIGGWL